MQAADTLQTKRKSDQWCEIKPVQWKNKGDHGLVHLKMKAVFFSNNGEQYFEFF